MTKDTIILLVWSCILLVFIYLLSSCEPVANNDGAAFFGLK